MKRSNVSSPMVCARARATLARVTGKARGMLPSQRALFDIPREICYLNAASWSPLPIATQEAGRAGVARKGRPWLTDPALPGEQDERARRAAAALINADPERVAL